MACLMLEEVGFWYVSQERAVLHDLFLSISDREIVALLGPSGCGKSTLLRLVAGLERNQAGRICIGDEVVASETVFVEPEHRQVGMVFQDYALFPHMTVRKNVAFGLHGQKEVERRRRVRETLELCHMDGHEDAYPHELSGGQQQRVAIARALAPSPRILLLDEPFSNLDAHLKARIRQDLRSILSDAKTTALLVTHDQEDARLFADRTVDFSHLS
ncbi:MAG: ABC transporter [Dethiosulfovibrio peptidovorans]|nr:MAG: ABC transporter [Dethiosulfovibrio peptidovorans]